MKREISPNVLRKYLSAFAIKLLLTPLFIAAPFAAQASGENNVHLYGALVAEPCVIPPGENEIKLNFGSIIDKYLYMHSRTPGKVFSIHLAGCDPSLGSSVKMTFLGTESAGLPGFLSVDNGSGATGIAIGLETAEAKPVRLNKAGDSFLLREGDNYIPFQAYVQGEPQAITKQSIKPGYFSATATFMLEYE